MTCFIFDTLRVVQIVQAKQSRVFWCWMAPIGVEKEAFDDAHEIMEPFLKLVSTTFYFDRINHVLKLVVHFSTRNVLENRTTGVKLSFYERNKIFE